MIPRRGYVYWVQMPGEQKRRPALVLSPERRNDRADTVVVVPCTTVRRFGPWNVAFRRGEGGLERDSVAKCEEITMVPKERIQHPALGGPLSAERMDEIRRAILRALDYE